MTIITSLPNAPAAIVPEFTKGDRLRKARVLAGLEQVELAGELGIHRQSVARYESDKAEPTTPVVVMWAWLTQVDVDWLATGKCTPRDSNSEPTGLESEILKASSAHISEPALDISVRHRPAARPPVYGLDAGAIAAELGLIA